MDLPRVPAPERLRSPDEGTMHSGVRGLSQELGLGPDTRVALRQRGGSAEAARALTSFLLERGRDYRTTMGSPVHAWESCSRLSPHLAWGTMSVRPPIRLHPRSKGFVLWLLARTSVFA